MCTPETMRKFIFPLLWFIWVGVPQLDAFSSPSTRLSPTPFIDNYASRRAVSTTPPLFVAIDGSSSSSERRSSSNKELTSYEDDDDNNNDTEMKTEAGVDKVFEAVDTDGSGAIDRDEYNNYLASGGYSSDEIEKSFLEMDTDKNGEVSKEEFRQAILKKVMGTDSNAEEDLDDDETPMGYFLNSVKQTYEPLGPIGRISQRMETLGPFKKAYKKISNLFGVDTKKISKLGVSFMLSYSIISNINGALSLSVAWYMSIKRTGLSPLVPGQWKSLLSSYAMIYGAIQILRPFRVAAAIAMSKLSAEYLEMTQSKLNCSRGVAIGCQYIMGQVMMGVCAVTGITFVSLMTGVPIMG